MPQIESVERINEVDKMIQGTMKPQLESEKTIADVLGNIQVNLSAMGVEEKQTRTSPQKGTNLIHVLTEIWSMHSISIQNNIVTWMIKIH